MVLLAFVVSPQPPKAKPGPQPAWVLAPGFAALVFAAITLPPHLRASQAVQAGDAGNWQLAASEMQAAAASDPNFGFYWLQLGYALGRGDHAGYSEAVEVYERGIAGEPVYALNYANLGVLHWSHGELEEAAGMLEKANSLAPESAVIALNLGLLEEELGRSSAEDNLVRALELDPRLAGAAIWRATTVRESALAQYMSSSVLSEQDEALQHVTQARAYIAQVDLEAAQDELARAYEINDQSVLVYVGMAELALAQNNLDLAQTYIDAALWLQAVRNHDKVEAILLGAEIALARGDTELATQRYEAAYRGVLSETSYGWGASGWSPYAWFVFQRVAFSVDLQPMMARADIPMDIAERLLVLADLYEESGHTDDAARVRASLAEYLH
jgi:Tfp pilus assembly protein PilF